MSPIPPASITLVTELGVVQICDHLYLFGPIGGLSNWGLVQMGVVQTGVVQMGVVQVQMGVVQMGVVQLGGVQMGVDHHGWE